MPEDTDLINDTDTNVETNYYDEMAMVKGNPEALAFAKKYKSAEEAILGGYNAEKKIGSSFRLPDDASNLTAEQKAEVVGYTKQFRDVPETADGYEITHAEGTEINQDFENAFRAFAFERGWDKKDVNEMVGWWDTMVASLKEKQYQDDEKAAIEAENNFRIIMGADYEKASNNIKRLLILHATELGLTYHVDNDVDEKGQPIIHSKLDDALDAKDAHGRALGNNPIILQWLNHIFNKYEAEGELIGASGGEEGVEGAALSKSFYSKKTED